MNGDPEGKDYANLLDHSRYALHIWAFIPAPREGQDFDFDSILTTEDDDDDIFNVTRY